MFQHKHRQPQKATQQPLQSPSVSEKTGGLFSFTKRYFKLPFSLSRSKRDLAESVPEKDPSKSLPPGLRQKRPSLTTSGRFAASERYSNYEGIHIIINYIMNFSKFQLDFYAFVS
jgi:hypothetical protein